VLELVNDGRRRVMAAATCAPEGNYLDRVAHQIINHIERQVAHRVRVKLVPLKFPQRRGALIDTLEQSLKLQLGHAPTDALEHVLNMHARPGPSGTVMVLWADWGVFGDGSHRQAKLTADELRAFITFARDRLAPACNEERLRVVTTIALEQVPERIQALQKTLQGLAGALEYRTPAFVFKVIPPLKEVNLVEIVEYLEQVGCDHRILHRLAGAIYAKTGGQYQETVAVLKQGLASSWHNLLGQVHPGAEQPHDDGLG
jgi:hypothetical protein